MNALMRASLLLFVIVAAGCKTQNAQTSSALRNCQRIELQLSEQESRQVPANYAWEVCDQYLPNGCERRVLHGNNKDQPHGMDGYSYNQIRKHHFTAMPIWWCPEGERAPTDPDFGLSSLRRPPVGL
jgi:hypothetical protein